MERVGARSVRVQGPCGKRGLGVFHRSGTIHRLGLDIDRTGGSMAPISVDGHTYATPAARRRAVGGAVACGAR